MKIDGYGACSESHNSLLEAKNKYAQTHAENDIGNHVIVMYKRMCIDINILKCHNQIPNTDSFQKYRSNLEKLTVAEKNWIIGVDAEL